MEQEKMSGLKFILFLLFAAFNAISFRFAYASDGSVLIVGDPVSVRHLRVVGHDNEVSNNALYEVRMNKVQVVYGGEARNFSKSIAISIIASDGSLIVQPGKKIQAVIRKVKGEWIVEGWGHVRSMICMPPDLADQAYQSSFFSLNVLGKEERCFFYDGPLSTDEEKEARDAVPDDY